MNGDSNTSDEKALRIAYLIAGYIQQTLTPGEHDELDEWVGESDENLLLFEQLTDEDNIQAGIAQMKTANEKEAYKRIRAQLPFKKQKKSITPWFYAIAASLILAVAAIYFFNHFEKPINSKAVAAQKENDILPPSNKPVLTLSDGRKLVLGQGETLTAEGNIKLTGDSSSIDYLDNTASGATVYHTLATPKGVQYSITLSDGTRVWLNAASSLKYPAAFSGSEREVVLTGEGYFEVAHDPAHPFHVKSKNQDITVLGTRFNVSAYNDDDETTTSLLEGKIELTAGHYKKQLAPGEQYFTASSGALIKNPAADVQGATAWKDGIFHFRNASLYTILKQVGRWYDAQIIYEGKIDNHFNADISKNLPVSKLLALLEKTGGVQFDIEGNKIKVKP